MKRGRLTASFPSLAKILIISEQPETPANLDYATADNVKVPITQPMGRAL